MLLTLATPAFSMVLGNSMQRQFEPTHEIRGRGERQQQRRRHQRRHPRPSHHPAGPPAPEPRLAVSARRDQCRYDDRFAAALPNVASTAGVSVVEASTATATARIAPVAIDASTGALIR